MTLPRNRNVIALTCLAAAVLALAAIGPSPVKAQGQAREFTINGNQFAFAPARIEVQKDDLVKITFTASDMAHSFIIDNPYRIAKRAGSGRPGRDLPLLLQPDSGRALPPDEGGARRKVGRPFRVAGVVGRPFSVAGVVGRPFRVAEHQAVVFRPPPFVCPRDWASAPPVVISQPFSPRALNRMRANRAQAPSIQRLSRSVPRHEKRASALLNLPAWRIAMTRLLLLVGLLFANTAVTSPAMVTARNATVQASGASEDCLRQYWECSFSTDRPLDQPDCFEQFMVCLQAQIG
jgi:hypothetical protein